MQRCDINRFCPAVEQDAGLALGVFQEISECYQFELVQLEMCGLALTEQVLQHLRDKWSSLPV